MDWNLKRTLGLKTFHIVKKGGIAFASVSASIFFILEVLSFFYEENPILNFLIRKQSTFIFLLFLFMAISITLMYLVIYICSENTYLNSNEKEVISYIKPLEEAYKNERYQEVIKVGKSLSPTLWYLGKYDIRIEVGTIVESASAECGEMEIQADTLIDDLGWTNIRIGNNKKALKNISRGLQIAESISNYYLIAKGNRHLSDYHLGLASDNFNLRYFREFSNNSIQLKQYELDECQKYHDLAMENAKLIPLEKKKKEMFGDLSYTQAKYFMVKGDFQESLDKLGESMNYYNSIQNIDKTIKLFSLKGNIYLAKNNEDLAISSFQEGIKSAKQVENSIHVVSNYLSLTQIYINNKDFRQANLMIEQAQKYSNLISDPILLHKVYQLKFQISQFSEGTK